MPDSVWPLSDKEIKSKSGHGTRRRSRPYSGFETEINMGDHPGGRGGGGGASNKFRNSSLPAVTKQHEPCLPLFDPFPRRLHMTICLKTMRRWAPASKRDRLLDAPLQHAHAGSFFLSGLRIRRHYFIRGGGSHQDTTRLRTFMVNYNTQRFRHWRSRLSGKFQMQSASQWSVLLSLADAPPFCHPCNTPATSLIYELGQNY